MRDWMNWPMPMPTLDLVMIARNEARCLARCLRSVRPWVDSMIVLDTGSSDHTVQVALEEGARVFHYDWCDDFAAARNAALAHSRADWRLVLDADEWLIDGGEALREVLVAHAASPAWVGVVAVESECDAVTGGAAGAAVSVNLISRLLPSSARYAGRIHEQVRCDGPRWQVPLRIGHDGYRTEFRAEKRGRNQRLLELALADAPGNAYLQYQLGKEAESACLYVEAAGWYARASQAAAADAPWVLDMTVRRLHCLSMAGEHETAVGLAGECAQRWGEVVDFHFVVGTVMLNWACAQPERAADCLPIAHASWQRCLALGDRARHDGAVRGRGGHLAAWNLMALHQGLGDQRQAAEYRALAQKLRSTPHAAACGGPCSSSDGVAESINARGPGSMAGAHPTH